MFHTSSSTFACLLSALVLQTACSGTVDRPAPLQGWPPKQVLPAVRPSNTIEYVFTSPGKDQYFSGLYHCVADASTGVCDGPAEEIVPDRVPHIGPSYGTLRYDADSHEFYAASSRDTELSLLRMTRDGFQVGDLVAPSYLATSPTSGRGDLFCPGGCVKSLAVHQGDIYVAAQGKFERRGEDGVNLGYVEVLSVSRLRAELPACNGKVTSPVGGTPTLEYETCLEPIASVLEDCEGLLSDSGYCQKEGVEHRLLGHQVVSGDDGSRVVFVSLLALKAPNDYVTEEARLRVLRFVVEPNAELPLRSASATVLDDAPVSTKIAQNMRVHLSRGLGGMALQGERLCWSAVDSVRCKNLDSDKGADTVVDTKTAAAFCTLPGGLSEGYSGLVTDVGIVSEDRVVFSCTGQFYGSGGFGVAHEGKVQPVLKNGMGAGSISILR